MFAGQSTPPASILNMSGVIPPIFASSLLLFPATIASFAGAGNDSMLGRTPQRIAASLSYGQPLHLVLYAALIIFFCFLLHLAGIQRARHGGQPEEVRARSSPASAPASRPRVHRQGAHA